MNEITVLKRFQEVCKQEVVVDFAQQILTESYTDCIPEPREFISNFLREVFLIIKSSCVDDGAFPGEMERISRELFQNQDQSFWFNQHYENYKRFTKPRHLALELEPLLCGKRILDFGCGSGLVSLALSERGYQVYLADEIDYRDKLTCHLPFSSPSADGKLPYPDSFFDDIVIFGVLHHIEPGKLGTLLGELTRISRQIIIEEDIYFLSGDSFDLSKHLDCDEQLQRSLMLSPDNQKEYLEFLDYYANVIVQGISNMNMPFGFRTLEEWHHVFSEQGLMINEEIPKGFQKIRFHRSNQVWFICRPKL